MDADARIAPEERATSGGTGFARWLAWTPPSGDAVYRPQLDGLRAVAVLLVLYAHFGSDYTISGLVGVKLFFVLSGYLITGILLAARAAGGGSLRNFYLRRGLRLWPIYYLVLGLLLLFDADGIRAVGWWHALYASNILFAIRQDFFPWYTAAWWSLAVEEQFYLLWPLAVAIIAPRRLAAACAAMMMASIAFCAAIDLLKGDDQLYGLLPAVLDCLAGGAMLAVLKRVRSEHLRHLPAAGLAGLASCGALYAAGLQDSALVNLPSVLTLAAIVHRAGEDSPWLPGRVLALMPMRYLGRISYGMYLYHLPLWWLAIHASNWWRIYHRGPVLFVGMTAVTVAVASLSWFLIEAPANRLKRRFPFP